MTHKTREVNSPRMRATERERPMMMMISIIDWELSIYIYISYKI
jgi:hypothetical protein